MSDVATAGPGNVPADPLQIIRDNLAEKYADALRRFNDLIEAFARVPEKIETEEQDGKIADFVKQVMSCKAVLDDARTIEKRPYDDQAKAVHAFFRSPIVKLIGEDEKGGIKAVLLARSTVFKRALAEKRRLALLEEQRKASEAAEAARKAAEAAEAAATTAKGLNVAIAAAETAKSAEAAVVTATKAAEVKAAPLTRTRGDLGGMGSLRTFVDFKDFDRAKISATDWIRIGAGIPDEALKQGIRAYIKVAGLQGTLDCCTIFENTQAVVR